MLGGLEGFWSEYEMTGSKYPNDTNQADPTAVM